MKSLVYWPMTLRDDRWVGSASRWLGLRRHNLNQGWNLWVSRKGQAARPKQRHSSKVNV